MSGASNVITFEVFGNPNHPLVSCVDDANNESIGTTTVTVPKGGNGGGDATVTPAPAKRRAVGRR